VHTGFLWGDLVKSVCYHTAICVLDIVNTHFHDAEILNHGPD